MRKVPNTKILRTVYWHWSIMSKGRLSVNSIAKRKVDIAIIIAFVENLKKNRFCVMTFYKY